jgi:hypothetical protein
MSRRPLVSGGNLLTLGALLGRPASPSQSTTPVSVQEKKPQPGEGRVPAFTRAQLTERTLHRRAVEAVFFGPQAPAGKESNWVSMKYGGRSAVLFRH